MSPPTMSWTNMCRPPHDEEPKELHKPLKTTFPAFKLTKSIRLHDLPFEMRARIFSHLAPEKVTNPLKALPSLAHAGDSQLRLEVLRVYLMETEFVINDSTTFDNFETWLSSISFASPKLTTNFITGFDPIKRLSFSPAVVPLAAFMQKLPNLDEVTYYFTLQDEDMDDDTWFAERLRSMIQANITFRLRQLLDVKSLKTVRIEMTVSGESLVGAQSFVTSNKSWLEERFRLQKEAGERAGEVEIVCELRREETNACDDR